jgi:competence ComEA-like helix-hairpin-helix protein
VTKEQQRGLVLLLCVGVLVGGAIILRPVHRSSAVRWVRPIVVADAAVVAPVLLEPKKIDVNSATVAELIELPGIGPALAARIVAYRTEHGPFRTVDDLKAVKGIGPDTVDGLRESAVAGGG